MSPGPTAGLCKDGCAGERDPAGHDGGEDPARGCALVLRDARPADERLRRPAAGGVLDRKIDCCTLRSAGPFAGMMYLDPIPVRAASQRCPSVHSRSRVFPDSITPSVGRKGCERVPAFLFARCPRCRCTSRRRHRMRTSSLCRAHGSWHAPAKLEAASELLLHCYRHGFICPVYVFVSWTAESSFAGGHIHLSGVVCTALCSPSASH